MTSFMGSDDGLGCVDASRYYLAEAEPTERRNKGKERRFIYSYSIHEYNKILRRSSEELHPILLVSDIGN